MAAAIPFVMLAGTALSMYGQSEAADAQLEESRKAKIQYQVNAKKAEAAASVAAGEKLNQAELLASRAQAVAAASGGGALDPTVVRLVSGIWSRGKYNAGIAQLEGADTAQTLRAQGEAVGREGAANYRASQYRAASTAMEGFKNYYSSYG